MKKKDTLDILPKVQPLLNALTDQSVSFFEELVFYGRIAVWIDGGAKTTNWRLR